MACISKRRGRWVIDFYDQHGIRQRITMPKGATRKEADKELDSYKELVRKGVYTPFKKVPLFLEVAREWIDYKKANLRETTWEVYEGHIRNHFDDLNRLKINRITVTTVENFLAARQVEGMNIGTLRKIMVTLGQILNLAVRRRYIENNPLRDAEKPRGQTNTEESEASGHGAIKILTPPQINAFLNQVRDARYRMLFMMAVFIGARQGELLGLKWSDVDWENRQIHIQRTFTKGRFFPTKTKASNRKVDLGPTVLSELKKWKLACPPNERDLIFPNEAGEPINYSNMVQRHFLPGLTAANLPRIRFHDLRHSYGSLLIDQGENIKYVQTQLGHANPTITLNVYAHLMKPTNQEAPCRLENAVLGTTGHKMVTKAKKGSRSKTVTP
jgi:integrase